MLTIRKTMNDKTTTKLERCNCAGTGPAHRFRHVSVIALAALLVAIPASSLEHEYLGEQEQISVTRMVAGDGELLPPLAASVRDTVVRHLRWFPDARVRPSGRTVGSAEEAADAGISDEIRYIAFGSLSQADGGAVEVSLSLYDQQESTIVFEGEPEIVPTFAVLSAADRLTADMLSELSGRDVSFEDIVIEPDGPAFGYSVYVNDAYIGESVDRLSYLPSGTYQVRIEQQRILSTYTIADDAVELTDGESLHAFTIPELTDNEEAYFSDLEYFYVRRIAREQSMPYTERLIEQLVTSATTDRTDLHDTRFPGLEARYEAWEEVTGDADAAVTQSDRGAFTETAHERLRDISESFDESYWAAESSDTTGETLFPSDFVRSGNNTSGMAEARTGTDNYSDLALPRSGGLDVLNRRLDNSGAIPRASVSIFFDAGPASVDLISAGRYGFGFYELGSNEYDDESRISHELFPLPDHTYEPAGVSEDSGVVVPSEAPGIMSAMSLVSEPDNGRIRLSYDRLPLYRPIAPPISLGYVRAPSNERRTPQRLSDDRGAGIETGDQSAFVRIFEPAYPYEVRYTIDGDIPEADDPRFEETLWLTEGQVVRAAMFLGDERVSDVSERTVEPAPSY